MKCISDSASTPPRCMSRISWSTGARLGLGFHSLTVESLSLSGDQNHCIQFIHRQELAKGRISVSAGLHLQSMLAVNFICSEIIWKLLWLGLAVERGGKGTLLGCHQSWRRQKCPLKIQWEEAESTGCSFRAISALSLMGIGNKSSVSENYCPQATELYTPLTQRYYTEKQD